MTAIIGMIWRGYWVLPISSPLTYSQDTSKDIWEKARWELYMDAACCFELISHFANHPGLYRRSKDKLINNVFLLTLTHGHTSIGQPAKIYIHQLCADTGCYLDDLPGVMADWDGWWERVSMLWWRWHANYFYSWYLSRQMRSCLAIAQVVSFYVSCNLSSCQFYAKYFPSLHLLGQWKLLGGAHFLLT